MSMIRLAGLVILAMMPACAPMKTQNPQRGYAGTVQKVYPVTLQGRDLPGMRFLGRVGEVLGPSLRKSRTGETNQYVVRTRAGQIMAQTDDEFAGLKLMVKLGSTSPFAATPLPFRIHRAGTRVPRSKAAYGPRVRGGSAWAGVNRR
jgi:hypothetical protein